MREEMNARLKKKNEDKMSAEDDVALKKYCNYELVYCIFGYNYTE